MEVGVSVSVFLFLLPPSCTAACPPGWSELTTAGLGCLLFSPESVLWTEGDQYCSRAFSNASMIEILTLQVTAEQSEISSQFQSIIM